MQSIVFDLDNTLFDTNSIIRDVFKKENAVYYPTHFWDFQDYPEYITKRILTTFKNKHVMGNLKPFPNVVNIIKNLKYYYNVYILTGRSKKMKDCTIKMLQNNKIDVPVYFTDEKPKLSFFKLYETNYYIDDCPLELQSISNLGVKTYMISNNDTKYNWYMRNNIEWFSSIEKIYHKLLWIL